MAGRWSIDKRAGDAIRRKDAVPYSIASAVDPMNSDLAPIPDEGLMAIVPYAAIIGSSAMS